MDLSNRVAIVTGSGRGIGRAIALKLAEVGATVVVNDINEAAQGVAEEIRAILEELGCKVLLIADAGTAGLQRVVKAAHKLIEEDVDVAVIVAGMEGALPSALASIVDIPIIGVPTSIGYGFGARGAAALMNMLQSCSLGLTVVNIDNGVAAAIAAYLILRRIKRK